MSQKIKFKRSASGKNNQSQSGITWKMDEEDEEGKMGSHVQTWTASISENEIDCRR